MAKLIGLVFANITLSTVVTSFNEIPLHWKNMSSMFVDHSKSASLHSNSKEL